MPPAAIASSVLTTIGSALSSPRRCIRSRNSRVDAGGDFGAPPNPPHSGADCGEELGRGRFLSGPRERLPQLARRARDGAAALAVELRDRLEDIPERR